MLSLLVMPWSFRGKANISSAASATKSFPFNVSSSTPKKKFNSLQIEFSSKLANNSKLTNNKHKKHFKNNLYLYYSVGDYKLNFYSKKQTTIISKGYSTSAATNPSVAVSQKLSEK